MLQINVWLLIIITRIEKIWKRHNLEANVFADLEGHERVYETPMSMTTAHIPYKCLSSSNITRHIPCT